MNYPIMTIRGALLCFFLSVLIFSSTSCTKQCTEEYDASRTYELGLDLQTLFMNDHVQLVVDGNICFDQIVSTNLVIAYAGGVKLNVQGGKHTLKIFVNENMKVSEQLLINRNQYTGIQYDRTAEQVTLIFSEKPFYYH